MVAAVHTAIRRKELGRGTAVEAKPDEKRRAFLDEKVLVRHATRERRADDMALVPAATHYMSIRNLFVTNRLTADSPSGMIERGCTQFSNKHDLDD